MNTTIGLVAGKSGDSLTDELHALGYRVAIVSGKASEPGVDTADAICLTDLRNKETIYSFFNENDVHFFIVGTGTVLAFDLAEYLEERGLISSVSVSASKLVKNKVKTKEAFIRISVDTPDYLYYKYGELNDIDSIIDKLGLPCVVKSNTDAVQPRCANSRSELEEAISDVIATSTDILIEKCIKGGDLTVCVANDGVRPYPVGVLAYSKAKEYKLTGFNNPYALTVTEDIQKELFEKSTKIIEELKMIGVVRIDYIINEEVSYALEVNSVIVTGYNGSAYPFFKSEGINIAKVSVNNALSVFKMKGLDA